ncbi:UNVERIFIED_CONTAM: Mitochondrial translocator assembly and maintenance protein 41 [Siphonaria sp. JEL0065]|nr:Mitochondrial translocator assembly and maintenance protein 41 [Siphonaria sp. JEL0065]
MEFRHGEVERGRTLFEGIVSHHPKRLDMWSVYLDMEIKNNDIDHIRRLFERAIALKLSSKKMKFLFKKYLEFEKSKGTQEGVKHVKEAAMDTQFSNHPYWIQVNPLLQATKDAISGKPSSRNSEYIETFFGFVKERYDAQLLVESTISGMLEAMHDLPVGVTTMRIRSGTCIVFAENSSQMQRMRWRDGAAWSSSKICGSFLLYREVESTTLPYTRIPEPERSSLFVTSSLRPNTRLTPNGLAKRTLSLIGSDKNRYRVINYFYPSDVEEFYRGYSHTLHSNPYTLQIPSRLPEFEHLKSKFASSPFPTSSPSSESVDVWADKKLISILDHFDAPVRCAAGYGSGVFKQIGYDDPTKKAPMIDLIFGVSHPEHWHYLNMEQNPSHYSFLSRFGAQPVAFLQEKMGAGMYFNTDITIDGMRIKYGVISMKHLLQDLTEWNNLYVAGRLQKPIKILRGDSRVKLANDQNLLNVLRVSLLLLPHQFTEKQLYNTIVGISYLGDFRMKYGENPKKVENIVNGQLIDLRGLYRPVVEKLAGSFVSVPEGFKESEIGLRDLVFEQDLNVQVRGGLLLELPKSVRDRIVASWQTENGYPAVGMPTDVLKGLELSQKIVSSPKIEQFVKSAIIGVVGNSALTQSLKGLVSAGPSKSYAYITEKLSKRN